MATLFLFGDKDMVALPIFVSANMATLSLFGDTTIAALSLFGDMTEVTGVPFILAFYNSHCPITIIIVPSQSQIISYPDLPRPKRSEIWVQD